MAKERYMTCGRCGKYAEARPGVCDECSKAMPLWPTDDEVRSDRPTTAIEQELYLFFCAGGHTRSQMAQAALYKAGFGFGKRPSGLDGPISWPDGKPIEFVGGNIVYRGFKSA